MVVAFLFVAVGGFGVLLWFMSAQGVERADRWASILAALLAYVVAAVGVVVWLVNRAGRRVEVDDQAALVRLRQAVRGTWTREVSSRNLHLPRPIRLRWRPTSLRGVQVAPDRGPRIRQPQGVLVTDDEAPPGAVLVDTFADPAVRQVVILGEPGAGKSTVVLLYVVAAVTTGDQRDAVPVPLSVAAWDPTGHDTVEGWIAQRICQDYPQLSAAEADQLVRQHQVIPVLDGLDEMPSGLRGAALEKLEEATGAGLRMVVTCRTGEFAEATSEVGVLPQAAVLEIEPVDPEDAATYLTDRETRDSTRWDQVTTALRTDPGGAIAAALSTPLMISLARQVYQRPQTRPEELVGLDGPDAVQRQLLARFLPSVYGADRAEQVGRWLAFLIRRLPAGPADPDLYWWRLGAALPRWLLIAWITAASTALGLLYGLIFGNVFYEDVLVTLFLFGITSFFLGLIGALHTARVTSPNQPGTTRWSGLRGIVLGVGDIYLAATAMSGLGAVVVLALHRVAGSAADAVSVRVVDTIYYLAWQDVTLIVALIGLSCVLVYRLGSGRAGLPRRSTPQLRALPSHLVSGLGVGLVFGVPVALIGPAVVEMTLDYALAAASVTIAFIAVVLGVGRWLNSPVTDTRHSPSPKSVLAADRTALLVTVGGVVAAVTVTMWAFINAHPTYSPIIGIGVGGLTGILVLSGSASAWLLYSLARVSFAMTGRLPWRLMGFLRDAHQAGVLRQAGAAYQIRHDLVRSYVADQWAPAPPGDTASPEPDPVSDSRWKTARRRLAVLVVATTVLAMLPVTARLTDPRSFADLGTTTADPAFSPDGRLVATVGESGKIYFWDGHTGEARAQTQRPLGLHARVIMKFTADGSGLTVVTNQDFCASAPLPCPTGTSVLTVDTRTGAETILARVDSVVALSPDGHTLAVDSHEDGLRLLNPFTGWSTDLDGDDPAGKMSESRLRGAFSPDGQTLAVGDSDSWQLWHVPTRQTIAPLRPTTGIRTLMFSGDGRRLVTWGDTFEHDEDWGVSLWDIDTGARIGRLTSDRFLGVAVSPDGLVL
ncbi:NACHT domain-containing protein, partial [Plantactinospora sp. CA-290183]|uniref:NACHT domain-containing protein n=1 Tax=Plantactinospora sp. CA-290183 TaxID=3240006 RepID=UPI003D8FEFA6